MSQALIVSMIAHVALATLLYVLLTVARARGLTKSDTPGIFVV